jgi:uncharacterized protein YdhG (YjbR/CyaY superfamily)
MKKKTKKSTARRSAAKGKPVLPTVDEYLEGLPDSPRKTLLKLRAAIRAIAPPEATESIWYRIPTFNYKGPLVGYAAFKKHCSLFPLSAALIAKLEKDVKKYRTSKGTIQFPMDETLPAPLLKKIIKARVAQNEARKRR